MKISVLTMLFFIKALVLVGKINCISNCEIKSYKNYIRILDYHLTFFIDLVDSNHQKTVSWFEESAHMLRKEIAGEIRHIANKRYLTIDEKQDLWHLEEWFIGHNSDLHHNIVHDMLLRRKNHFLNTKVFYLYELSTWLLDSSKEVLSNTLQIKHDIKKYFSSFPFDKVYAQLQSKTLQKAFQHFQGSGSFEKISECWEAMVDFILHHENGDCILFDRVFSEDIKNDGKKSTEQHVSLIHTAFKDISNLIYLLYYHVESVIIDSKGPYNYILNLVDIYQEIDALGIEDLLNAINRFIKKLTSTFNNFEEKSESSFNDWLKSKWVTIPLAVGVIIVKVAHYFLTRPSQNQSINWGSIHE